MDAMEPRTPEHRSCGVVHFEGSGWHVYFAGRMDDHCYSNRTDAIRELARRDRPTSITKATTVRQIIEAVEARA